MPSGTLIEVGLDGFTHAVASPAQACDHHACFKQLVRQRATAAGTVVLAVTNTGFAHFWHNLRCSLERLDLARHTIIVGTDREACAAADAAGVACIDGGRLFWPRAATATAPGTAGPSAALAQGAVEHGTKAYADLMHVKARPALEVLRLGFSVVMTDTDVVWLRDPLRALAAAAAARGGEQVDAWIQSDHDESNAAACTAHEQCARSHWCDGATGECAPEVCGGFYWLRPGGASEALLEGMFALFERQADERTGEQPALNYMLRRTPRLRHAVLDRALYPNGASFFTRGLRPPPPQTPVIVHNNWLRGAEAKRARFERHGLWLLADGEQPRAPPRCIATAVRAADSPTL